MLSRSKSRVFSSPCLALSLVLLGALVACGGDSETATPSDASEAGDGAESGDEDGSAGTPPGETPSEETPSEATPPDEPAPGEGSAPAWNPSTCQVDDDGSSQDPGGLEVRSRVLVEDSAPDANDGITVYYPELLETDDGCIFQVIGWGNGTTGFGGGDYPVYFNRLASYGFVVAVAHTNQTLSDDQPILAAVNQVMTERESPGSVFFGKLDPAFGLMGKSQGAIAAARELQESAAVAAVLIASGSMPDMPLTKPGLFVTGDSDFARQFVINAYDAAAGPATLAQAAQDENPQGDPAAGHQDLNDREGAVQLSASFMRCHLQGNDNACTFVQCAECQQEPWTRFESKNGP